jgi:DNA polymerase-3 subunit alpha (Gram-positive type)
MELMKMIRLKGCETVNDLNRLGSASPDAIKKSRTYHGIILVKNEVGRVNLYRLISEAHINYFSRTPRMPKSLINQYREGLIIGSACEAGELYRALLDDAPDEEITRIVKFYDYLEIQPTGNNMFLLDKKDNHIDTVEDIQNINKRIIQLGKTFHKPVVATCDVHFLDPEDSIYRAIIMAGKGFEDADRQPPLYYRTTEEMLKEFEYLGSDLAKEVVITNTNKIADQIEKISPVRPDKQPPIIENSDETLTKICYDRAHEIYGPELPQIVVDRLERELHSIISNGFAVMYIIAQKLVWKSNADGYLVGSRGSVGSSFVATMAGITEVNPLSAHYICPECHYVDFDSELVKSFVGMSGCDMPDKDCPVCGHKLNKEGHDIPFETFLGFKGDKEPDIDLNFSGEYQPNAHAYTEELFGKGKAFRAGTIGTLAEKTAVGYVYKYFEERGQVKRRAEMERLAKGCTGVKRTTGQHPGGMIVLPKHEEIYSFTPIQKPANDMTTDTITTHFEYHSIDHNLLKLDILGHDDPTMIRRLEDLTGFNAKEVPLDDESVMSLFHEPTALGITPADIGGTPLGSLGIPEFGTDFAMQMLIDANPQSFSDLVRISGLSHGTDVWLGNAKTLIEEGKCVLSSAICCRDDIMIYLISMGLEKGLAFTIMESVRKGKGLKDEWIDEMLSHGVPDWYIWSCKKIKYMFPKAHAAAYVMMAWRIAYYKVHFPLAYYAAFLAIRASAFSYELMCLGREKLEYHLEEYRKKDKNQMTAKEQDTLRDMRIVQEMYARGFEFMPIDIYKADDKKFQIIDGKIMPSLASIDGMGEKAATQLKEAAAQGIFLSREEVRNRAKLSKTIVDKMGELGILGDLPETSQLTFDFL